MNRIIIRMQMSATDLQLLVVESSMIIVVSRLLFWLAIFRSEDSTNKNTLDHLTISSDINHVRAIQ